MTAALIVVICLAVGVAAWLAGRAMSRTRALPPPPERTEEERKRLIEGAKAEAASLRKQAELDGKDLALKARKEVEDDLRTRRADLDHKIHETAAKEQNLGAREKALRTEMDALAQKSRQLQTREEAAEAAARNAASAAAEAKTRLEKIAGMTVAEAKDALLAEIRDEARRQASAEVKKIEDQAREEAETRSKTIISAAIQRYAGEYVAERTVATVPLPSDDMKGRIIGREGRNVRALEAATGVDLIIDDTPEAVVISCFNPVRREIARLALTRLIADGRIHPTRIEEMVAKATEEVEQQCKDAGEQAAFDLGITRLHPELIRMLGRLKLRSSSAQNLLLHSVEVGFLAGAMAAELGLSVKTARRAGLLHDIGKGVDQEVEGSHAAIGAAMARKLGEPPAVCHAIESHHGEIAAPDLLDHIVDAANVLSGHRPGARREMLESYVRRLADLERMATGFPGVERAFAIQAGREVRVLVENSKVTDEQARFLAKDIARKIETGLTYPGQIRVSVVRETRATDYAK